MLMRQAALLTALAAAGRAAFDACGEPTKGPVLGGLDVVDAWAKALEARNATARLPHVAEAPPLRGSADFKYTTKDGFALHFATEANRDAYAADPSKYALGAGGYCGLGASGRDPRCPEGGHCRGPACGTSPLTFQVSGVDGKLYFFLGAGARQIFNEDEKASVAGASAKVKAVEAATGRACFNTDLLGCRTPGMAPGGGNATRAGAWRQRLNQGFLGPGGMLGQRGPAPGGQQRPGTMMGGQRPGTTGQRPDGQQRPGGAAGGQQRPDGQRGPGAMRGDGQRPGGPNGGQRPGPRGGDGGGDGARQPAPKRKKTAWESVKAWIWGA